jgi:phospholipid transport system transporter-binding protein
MAQATLTSTGTDQFAVTGNLSFATVGELLDQSKALFATVPSIDIDLSAVLHADGAGLALLLEWLRYGKQANKAVRYHNLPAQLQSLAEISEVEELFTPSH